MSLKTINDDETIGTALHSTSRKCPLLRPFWDRVRRIACVANVAECIFPMEATVEHSRVSPSCCEFCIFFCSVRVLSMSTFPVRATMISFQLAALCSWAAQPNVVVSQPASSKLKKCTWHSHTTAMHNLSLALPLTSRYIFFSMLESSVKMWMDIIYPFWAYGRSVYLPTYSRARARSLFLSFRSVVLSLTLWKWRKSIKWLRSREKKKNERHEWMNGRNNRTQRKKMEINKWRK